MIPKVIGLTTPYRSSVRLCRYQPRGTVRWSRGSRAGTNRYPYGLRCTILVDCTDRGRSDKVARRSIKTNLRRVVHILSSLTLFNISV